MLCLLLFSTGPSYAATSPAEKNHGAGKIAFFPFENLSENKNALDKILPVLKGQLEKRGIEIADDGSVDAFLLRERFRFSGYISKDLAVKLGKELQVSAVVLGAVTSFSEKDNPEAGLSLRLVSTADGSLLWANNASATGDDFTGILGLGRIGTLDKLVPVVIKRLLASFNMNPPRKEVESTYKIAVMPFQNRSKAKNAGAAITYMFIGELFKDRRYIPFEYGDIRKAIVEKRIREKGELDYKNMDFLSGDLDADGFLVGTVEVFSEKNDASSPPEVALNIRLIDARKKRILWYDSYHLNGDDDIFILDFGKLRSVDEVARKVISKLIKRMGKAKWF